MTKFLNHLCDEEHFGLPAATRHVFLNHLCDEEHLMNIRIPAIYFLNHLCDEELDDFVRKASS